VERRYKLNWWNK